MSSTYRSLCVDAQRLFCLFVTGLSQTFYFICLIYLFIIFLLLSTFKARKLFLPTAQKASAKRACWHGLSQAVWRFEPRLSLTAKEGENLLMGTGFLVSLGAALLPRADGSQLPFSPAAFRRPPLHSRPLGIAVLPWTPRLSTCSFPRAPCSNPASESE